MSQISETRRALGVQHLLDDLFTLGAARKFVGVGAQAAFLWKFTGQITLQYRIIGEFLEDLLDGQTFRQGDRKQDRLSGFEQFHDVVHRGTGLDFIFPGFQCLAVEFVQ